MHPRTPLFACLLAGAVLLTACGDDDTGAAVPADVEPVGATGGRIEVVGDDFAFDPPAISVPAGEDVTVALTSHDTVHDLTIDELDVKVVANAGDTAEGTISAGEPGTYTFYCSIPGHRGAGMVGTLTVE